MAKKSVEEVLQMGASEVNSENGIDIPGELKAEAEEKKKAPKETRGRKLPNQDEGQFLENAMDILKKGIAPKKDRMLLCEHLSKQLFEKKLSDRGREVLLYALGIGQARNELRGELLYAYAELEMDKANQYYQAKEDHPHRMLNILKDRVYKGRYVSSLDRFEIFVKIVTAPMAQLDQITASQLAAGVLVDPSAMPKEKIRYRLVSMRRWEFESFFTIVTEENYRDEYTDLGVFQN